MRPGLTAILYLQRRIVANWFRRSMRSPFFWIVALFLAFVLVSQIVAVINGPEEPAFGPVLESATLGAIAATVIAGAILIGLWRGTSTTPAASLADVVIMMGSPVSARVQFAVLLFRGSAINALVIGLWALAASGGAVFGASDDWISVRVLFLVMIAVLLSEFLRNATWIGLEQVVARSPATGRRVRSGIKVTAMALAAATGVILLGPVWGVTDEDWRAILNLIIDRGEILTHIPPMSLAANALTPGGLSFLNGLTLALITGFVGSLALYWAKDFVEPIAVNAERKTDARGQILEAGSDVQWAVLTQYGASPRMKITVPSMGSGAWALLWGGLNRWVRYQIAAAWITIVIMGLLGLATAIGVRIGFLAVEVAWGMVLVFPFFGSVNMFMDELRRQFIYLIPASSWARLAAGAVTSVLDGLISAVIMIGLLLAFGVLPVSHAIGLTLLSLAIALLAQASLALIQVILPFWTGQRIRISATFGLTALGFLPGFGLLVAFYVTAGPMAGLLVSFAATSVAGIIILIAAGLLFDRIEHPG